MDAIDYPGRDQPELVKLLIQSGADLHRRITWTAGREVQWLIGDNATLLHYAAEAGNRQSARVLIEAGVDVNATDADGQTPLHLVVLQAAGEDATSTRRFVDLARLLAQSLKCPRSLIDALERAKR